MAYWLFYSNMNITSNKNCHTTLPNNLAALAILSSRLKTFGPKLISENETVVRNVMWIQVI